jgi:hypothetical protein
MSPEQAEGKPVGPPSDIFSLGAVLTFAATGAGPFGTGSSASLLYKVVNGQPDVDGVPDPLRPLIKRCLDKDPASRPTANQVLTDVTAVYPPTPEMGSWLPSPIFDMASYGPSYTPHDAHQEPTWDVVVPPRPTGDLLIPPAPAPAPAAGRRRKQRWYIAGAVILAAAAGALIAVLIPSPAPQPVTRLLEFSQLQTGDCLTGADVAATLGTSNSWPTKVTSVPCDQSHLAEVYYANENYWPKSEAFPSYNALVDQANSQCENQQAAYTGVPYAQSSKTYRENVIGPFSSDIWARGDRELVCVAYHSTTAHPDGATMTASIKH